jgi:hypothetical protein
MALMQVGKNCTPCVLAGLSWKEVLLRRDRTAMHHVIESKIGTVVRQ